MMAVSSSAQRGKMLAGREVRLLSSPYLLAAGVDGLGES